MSQMSPLWRWLDTVMPAVKHASPCKQDCIDTGRTLEIVMHVVAAAAQHQRHRPCHVNTSCLVHVYWGPAFGWNCQKLVACAHHCLKLNTANSDMKSLGGHLPRIATQAGFTWCTGCIRKDKMTPEPHQAMNTNTRKLAFTVLNKTLYRHSGHSSTESVYHGSHTIHENSVLVHVYSGITPIVCRVVAFHMRMHWCTHLPGQ